MLWLKHILGILGQFTCFLQKNLFYSLFFYHLTKYLDFLFCYLKMFSWYTHIHTHTHTHTHTRVSLLSCWTTLVSYKYIFLCFFTFPFLEFLFTLWFLLVLYMLVLRYTCIQNSLVRYLSSDYFFFHWIWFIANSGVRFYSTHIIVD